MPAECSVGAKPCVPFSCLTHLLEDQAKRIPDAPAILAVGRAPLTYAGLYQHINKTLAGCQGDHKPITVRCNPPVKVVPSSFRYLPTPLYRYQHGDPNNVIAFTVVCCCASCDKSSSAVEGPQPQPLGA